MPKTILIIEDEAALAYALKARLTVDGYNVSAAASAEEAFAFLKKIEPDCIVLDILLPEMDGFEFLEKLKKDKKFNQVPVVITSNLSKKEDVERGIKLGAKDFLIKTEFDLDSLVKKIKEFIA